MTGMGRCAILGGALAALLATAACAQTEAEAWWADVGALAHDSMRGRAAGSAEHRRAAEFVAAAFQRAGLRPSGTNGYYQPVRLVVHTLDEERSSLTIVRDGEADTLVLGRDAYLSTRAPRTTRIEAPVVFVGYGLALPEYGHDDLAGLDLRGAVVAYLSGLPRGIPGPVVSDARSRMWQVLRAAGAVGTLAFSGATAGSDIGWEQRVAMRLQPQMALADTGLDALAGLRVAVTTRATVGARLFAGTPYTLAGLAARADSGLPLPRFALPVSVRATVTAATTEVESDNVVGMLPGSDPARRDEYVVLTAHLDHVGVGAPVAGDSVYNGAMDNASGTAMLLWMARSLSGVVPAPARSIVFLAVTAEERGLLGSKYYAAHPTVPVGAMVANVNTDMFLPIIPLRSVIVNGLEESDLADDVRAAAAGAGVAAVPDPEPERNAFVRSDQYSFIRAGIPAVSLKVGFERGTPEHRRILAFRRERYHRPSDDPAQPVDLASAAAFQAFYVLLVRHIADRPARPAWNGDSFFGRYAGADASHR